MEKIEENELIKLLDILRSLNIDEKVIKALCHVNRLLDLSKVQYNYLLYILCLKKDERKEGENEKRK